MERKLIPQGLGGFTVYLPKKWIDKKGLTKEDTISITESNGDLIIRKDKTSEKTSTINFDKTDTQYIHYWLTHIYRNNYSKIIITGKELPIKEITKIVEKLLLGFLVTNHTNDKCVIENIAEPSGEKYESILRRLFFIIKNDISTIQESLNKKDKETLNEVIKSREQFDKYVYFCKRVIHNDRYNRDPLIHWELLTFLTHVQHSINYFAEFFKENFQTTKTVNEFIKGLDDYFQSLYNAYFTKDMKYFLKIMQERKKYHFGGIQNKLINNEDNTNPATLSYLQAIFRMIQITASPIFEEFLDDQKNP
ncbi:phosphate uptake regulator PhoU [Candidatus Woesearchaeota archaeon]|nr:phosphate uptake regulator PhoU [Candidatus Woesearchaeota archaeon]